MVIPMNILLPLLLENASNVTEEAEKVGEGINALAGNWELLVGAAVLLIAAIIVVALFREVIANAIIGIIALLILKYLLGIPIPLTPLVILVTVLGGGGGVSALLIATYFGWL